VRGAGSLVGFPAAAGRGVQMDHARDLTRAVAARCPRGSRVLARANACEVIAGSTRWTLIRPPGMGRRGGRSDGEPSRERLAPVLASGRPYGRRRSA
jgi:hypothetical protein